MGAPIAIHDQPDWLRDRHCGGLRPCAGRGRVSDQIKPLYTISMIQRLSTELRRLRWKLALAYTFTTASVLTVLFILLSLAL